MFRNERTSTILTAAGLLLAAVLGLLGMPNAALAATFGINGQVFRVDPGEAADPTIEDADLELRDPLPYVKVRVVDAATRAVLGEPVWAAATGNFALTFDAPAGASVEVQALRVIDGEGEVLPAAREGMNTITLSSPATAVAVKVASDEAVDLEAAASSSHPGIGIIFTEVGKVEIPYICQEICTGPGCEKVCTQEEVGLADMSTPEGSAAAGELHLPDAFRDAPFGGGLLIFGVFGPPEGTPGCTSTIDWYKVKYRTMTFNAATSSWVPGAWTYWTQEMEKTRYQIDFFPFRADAFREKVGPFTADNLYRVRPLPTAPGQVVVYSFANLRMNWRTAGLNGLYEIAMEYFTQIGGTDTNPTVAAIPASCVDATLPPDEANQVALNKLRLRLNNQEPTVALDGIFVRSSAPPANQYLQQTRASCTAPPPARTSDKSSALDFNAAANLCDIMELDSSAGVKDVVEIDFKARHDGGYLHSYSLRASSNNDPPNIVPFASDDYASHAAGGVLWHGLGTSAAPKVSRTNGTPFPHSCAYNFDLVVRTRIQNGYGYVHYPHIHRAYYVKP